MELMIFYLILALSVSFLCSVLEAILLSTPSSFIILKESDGSASAILLKKLKQNIDKPLAAILSLNTIAHTIGAAGVGAEAVKVFGEVYFGLISAILTVLILVLSEILPKSVGAKYWRRLALPSAHVIQVMIYTVYPLVIISEWLTRLIGRNNTDPSVSREEVTAMVNIGVEEGVFRNKESHIIQSMMRMKDLRVSDVMTPRVVTETLSEEMTFGEFIQNRNTVNYSRIPLYTGDTDNITGYIFRRSVFERLITEKREDKTLKDLKREIMITPSCQSLTSLWEGMLKQREHIALVVDEYGGFDGIVTMEDIIESSLGFEIVDEKDTVTDMQQYAREKWKKKQTVSS